MIEKYIEKAWAWIKNLGTAGLWFKPGGVDGFRTDLGVASQVVLWSVSILLVAGFLVLALRAENYTLAVFFVLASYVSMQGVLDYYSGRKKAFASFVLRFVALGFTAWLAILREI